MEIRNKKWIWKRWSNCPYKWKIYKNYIILFPEDGQKYLDYSQLNSKFKIYLSDKNIKTDEDEYEINPAKSLEYSAYIGLKCQNNISKLNYTIQFLIKDSNNMQIELNISPVTVAIDRTPTKIKLL